MYQVLLYDGVFFILCHVREGPRGSAIRPSSFMRLYDWDIHMKPMVRALSILSSRSPSNYRGLHAAYMEFIFERLKHKNPDGSLQIMYTIHGGKDLEEIELTHLDGHKGSKPVRIGNGAADHLQLVCYLKFAFAYN